VREAYVADDADSAVCELDGLADGEVVGGHFFGRLRAQGLGITGAASKFGVVGVVGVVGLLAWSFFEGHIFRVVASIIGDAVVHGGISTGNIRHHKWHGNFT
jgi:hypothetical protein